MNKKLVKNLQIKLGKHLCLKENSKGYLKLGIAGMASVHSHCVSAVRFEAIGHEELARMFHF